ncbi:MAG: MotA/TolQ/ExbB proton channel family protein [Kiritimatiellae bacterium]|nr:MotA/TolQ/ExbB proton channel family protein [Kiritimatiellia bacterium]MDD3544739.1 MotA/TolQ/ExbB proton channel family protein [Kiritimatiellia bacterium]MDD4025266.1 MotA/TolQ/ExbB proton channel family protein [Kiritimatiellia bacterium]
MRAKKAMLYTLAYAGWLTGAFAQEAAAPGAAPAAQAYGMSFAQAWEYGGWIMWLLAAISVFALAMVFYFLTALRGGAVIPRELMVDLMAQIRSGNLNEVRRLCDRHPCPLSAVTLTALDCLRNVPQCDVALLRGTAEAEGARQAEAIQGQTELLLDIATIAPLLGLLGTVLGMLTAFGSVASDIASAKPVVLAAGVSQALVTTIFGLIVAIPCMAFYAWFRRRASRQIANLEAATSELLTALIGMGDKAAFIDRT